VDKNDVLAVAPYLPSNHDTEHFVLHYLSSDQRSGRLGPQSVRGTAIIEDYAEGLEAAYRLLSSSPYSRHPPRTDDTGKTHVYVCDPSMLIRAGCPFASHDAHHVPYIVLPSRSRGATLDEEKAVARAQAAHETTHAFNFLQRPLDQIDTAAWAWLDEGTAVHIEATLCPGAQVALPYAASWVSRPEIPLDVERAWYLAGAFVSYLCEKYGAEFLRQVWMQQDPTALAAIGKVARGYGSPFVDATPGSLDLFARGYCTDSYFPAEAQPGKHLRYVYERYGSRVPTSSHELTIDHRREQFVGEIDHLACRYHRLYVGFGEECSVSVEAPCADRGLLLKAHLAVVQSDGGQGHLVPLYPVGEPTEACMVKLAATLTSGYYRNADHLVLVVSNCGLLGNRDYNLNIIPDNDDHQPYAVEISIR
jgi:hypothetical protein